MNGESFIQALESVGPTPCEKYECGSYNSCAKNSTDCKAFRYWVNNGVFYKYSKKRDVVVDICSDVERLIRPMEIKNA